MNPEEQFSPHGANSETKTPTVSESIHLDSHTPVGESDASSLLFGVCVCVWMLVSIFSFILKFANKLQKEKSINLKLSNYTH
jgi:hypothetical protein